MSPTVPQSAFEDEWFESGTELYSISISDVPPESEKMKEFRERERTPTNYGRFLLRICDVIVESRNSICVLLDKEGRLYTGNESNAYTYKFDRYEFQQIEEIYEPFDYEWYSEYLSPFFL